MNTPWYDDKAVMINHIFDLEKFNDLIKIRSKVRNSDNDTRLNEFIINKYFFLDQFGQVSTIGKLQDSDYNTLDLNSLSIPPIVTIEEFRTYLPKGASYSYSMGASIPNSNSECACCHKKWSMNDIHLITRKHTSDVINLNKYLGMPLKEVENLFSLRTDSEYYMQNDILIRNDKWIDKSKIEITSTISSTKNEFGWSSNISDKHSKNHLIDRKIYVIQEGDFGYFNINTYYHPECLQLKVNSESRMEFIDSVGRSSIRMESYTEIPNKYGSESYNGQWMKIETTYGEITVGWRKRVIQLDYSSITTDNVFKHYDTTNENGMVHLNNHLELTLALGELVEYMSK